MVLLTQFRLEKAVRISRPFCRLPKIAQNLHQPTYSHLLPELDAEPLPHEHARTQSPEVCCIMRGQPSTRCEWLAWLKRIVARCPVYPEAFARRPTHHPFKFTEERTP